MNTQAIPALTLGDINGIGPELILRSASVLPAGTRIAGPRHVLAHYATLLDLDLPGHWRFDESVAILPEHIRPGHRSAEAGEAAMASVRSAVATVQAGQADYLVTAPLSKEGIAAAGYTVPGHTEYLQQLTGAPEVGMLLAADSLRVALTTIHIPISQVAARITETSLTRSLDLLIRSLAQDFGLPHPRVAVLGLNPHAGDGGVLGTEETTLIHPVIQRFRTAGHRVEGPFPADGFFGSGRHRTFDAVLAQYHDQGLIPFKTLAFDEGVNVTMGLPIIRTSPDHGTAYDLAGTGRARPHSYLAALRMGAELVHNRQSISNPA